MKHKVKSCLLMTIVALVLCAGFQVPAYADEPKPEDGNLTVVEQGTNSSGTQEFYQVQSKNGNTFYIIIDRTKNTENVYFLNQVDEADLMALIGDDDIQPQEQSCVCDKKCTVGHVNTDCPVCAVNMTECFGVTEEEGKTQDEASTPSSNLPEQETPTSSEEPAPASEGHIPQQIFYVVPVVIILAVVLVLGILKLKKKKQQAIEESEAEYEFQTENEDMDEGMEDMDTKNEEEM